MEQLKGTPNIVVIEDHAVLHDDGEYSILIRMELLEELRDYIARKGALSANDVVKLGIDICQALSYCEKRNIVHRDIKEGNLYVGSFGDFKIGDFGISKAFDKLQGKDNQTSVGTLSYAAPEIFNGEKYDSTIDTYSLGIVLYTHLNHGRLPFCPAFPQPVTSEDIARANRMRMQKKRPPLPSQAPEELGKIICRACSPFPQERYSSASDFKVALEAYKNKMSALRSDYIRLSNEKKADNMRAENKKPDNNNKKKDDHKRVEQDKPLFRDEAHLISSASRTKEISVRRKVEKLVQGKNNVRQRKIEKTTANCLIAEFVLLLLLKSTWCILVYFTVGLLICWLLSSIWIRSSITKKNLFIPFSVVICALFAAYLVSPSYLGEPEVVEGNAETIVENDSKKTDESTHVHKWKAATYDEPKACEICGKTEGFVKGYVKGDELNQGGYSDEAVEINDFNVYPWVFDNVLKKCRMIKAGYSVISDIGDPLGKYNCYVRSNGKWKKVDPTIDDSGAKIGETKVSLKPQLKLFEFLFENLG